MEKTRKVRLYSVYDSIAQEFGPLYEAVNDAVAYRKFNMLIKDMDDSVVRDYSVYFCGVRDINTGGVFSEVRLLNIDDILDLKITEVKE